MDHKNDRTRNRNPSKLGILQGAIFEGVGRGWHVLNDIVSSLMLNIDEYRPSEYCMQ